MSNIFSICRPVTKVTCFQQKQSVKEWTPGGASLAALGWATANRGVLGGPIRCPARDYLLCCLNVIVRNCRKLYYVRGVWNRDDQQVPDYKAGQV